MPPVRVLAIIGIVLVIAVAAYLLLSTTFLSGGILGNNSTSRNTGILPIGGQCSAGLTPCSGKCVDLMTDSDNCGKCGFSVPFGESCINGQFSSVSGGNGSTASSATTARFTTRTTCPPGQFSCSGICRDLLNDPKNCGGCGKVCPPGQTCQYTICVSPTVSAAVVNTSIPVTEPTDNPCTHGEKLCGSSCVDLFTNKNHCGVCGRACGSQEICVSARCGPACTEKGTTLCGDTCVNLETDADNCGGCGKECASHLPNAKGSECEDGKCVISQCSTDYGDCNEKVSDGCEVNFRTDANNCGGCGDKCPSGQVCYNKKCSVPIGT